MARRLARRDPRDFDAEWPRRQRQWSAAPALDLAWCVSQYSVVAWDYRGRPPNWQRILPAPTVQLSFVAGGPAMVYGVSRRPASRFLAGAGRVFCVAFRPGCFRPFLGHAVSTITNRSITADDVWGSDAPQPAIDGAAYESQMLLAAEQFLRSVAPRRDPVAERIADIVELIASTPKLTRVTDLADTIGCGVRLLQRRFAEYVGVGPKWVIRCHRLREATERMTAGAIDWARIACQAGYADQAHFCRDFTAMIGESPTAYAARHPTGRLP